MKSATFIIALLAIMITGCASPAHVDLLSGAEKVRVAKNDPPPNFIEVGSVSASVGGGGCGGFGQLGTPEAATNTIKNKAYELGANYVQLFTINEPYLHGDCFINTYSMSGMAYKKSAEAVLPNTPTPQDNNTDARLLQKLTALKELKEKSLITTSEYDEQRKKLLEDGMRN